LEDANRQQQLVYAAVERAFLLYWLVRATYGDEMDTEDKKVVKSGTVFEPEC
jgi:hypothetical protein